MSLRITCGLGVCNSGHNIGLAESEKQTADWMLRKYLIAYNLASQYKTVNRYKHHRIYGNF